MMHIGFFWYGTMAVSRDSISLITTLNKRPNGKVTLYIFGLIQRLYICLRIYEKKYIYIRKLVIGFDILARLAIINHVHSLMRKDLDLIHINNTGTWI